MIRISFDEIKCTVKRILEMRKVDADDAEILSGIIANNSLDGVHTHGINRFPRIVSNLESGVIDASVEVTLTSAAGSMECWDGHYGIGAINAFKCMRRAIELASQYGIGLVALRHNNHWLRGGTYGLQAAENGFVGICWSNTMPNMPVWGGKKPNIGNNPLIISVPRSDGRHFVFDSALSQFSYGKLEECRLKGVQLPFYGGFDNNDELTTDPAVIEKNGRLLPIGYWKGSGLSIALDLVATILSDGNSVTEVGRLGNEKGLTQIMIVIDPCRLNSKEHIDHITATILDDIDESDPGVHYPGERMWQTRRENEELGIPIIESVWNEVLGFL